MLSSVEQAFVERDEKRAPLKTPAWEAILGYAAQIWQDIPAFLSDAIDLFYRYGGHIELIRFKEYYRMPRGHEHISFVFLSAFRDIFS